MLLFMQELNRVVYFDDFSQMVYNAFFFRCMMDSKTGSHHQNTDDELHGDVTSKTWPEPLKRMIW